MQYGPQAGCGGGAGAGAEAGVSGAEGEATCGEGAVSSSVVACSVCKGRAWWVIGMRAGLSHHWSTGTFPTLWSRV